MCLAKISRPQIKEIGHEDTITKLTSMPLYDKATPYTATAEKGKGKQ